MNPPKKRYVLVLVPWILLICVLAPSSSSLDHVVYWLALVGFAIPTTLLVITGNPDLKGVYDDGDYIFKVNRLRSILLGVTGLSVLFILAAVMNSPYPKSVKTDVFLGATSGMMVAIACSVTCIEVLRGRHAGQRAKSRDPMAARFDDGGPLMRRTKRLQFIGSRVQIVMSSESSWEFGIRSVTGQVTGILLSSDRRLPFYEVSLTEPAAVEELRRDGVSTDSLTGIKSVAVQGANVGSNPEDIISSPQTEILVDVVRIGGTSKERRLPSLRRSTSPDYLGYGQLRLVDSDSVSRHSPSS